MCVYVGSEVVLANLLAQKSGVTILDIDQYCEKLKEILRNESQVENVYIGMNDREIEGALLKYAKEFRFFQGCYFTNEKINLHQFNSRFTENVASALVHAAQNV